VFWGRGDSSKLEEREAETLRQLRRMVETGHIVALDDHKVQIALRAIDFYARWESAMSVFQSVRNVLYLFAGGLFFWWVTGGENFVTDFIRSVAGGGS
jgi:hypothetical protein